MKEAHPTSAPFLSATRYHKILHLPFTRKSNYISQPLKAMRLDLFTNRVEGDFGAILKITAYSIKSQYDFCSSNLF